MSSQLPVRREEFFKTAYDSISRFKEELTARISSPDLTNLIIEDYFGFLTKVIDSYHHLNKDRDILVSHLDHNTDIFVVVLGTYAGLAQYTRRLRMFTKHLVVGLSAAENHIPRSS